MPQFLRRLSSPQGPTRQENHCSKLTPTIDTKTGQGQGWRRRARTGCINWNRLPSCSFYNGMSSYVSRSILTALSINAPIFKIPFPLSGNVPKQCHCPACQRIYGGCVKLSVTSKTQCSPATPPLSASRHPHTSALLTYPPSGPMALEIPQHTGQMGAEG